MAEARSTKAGEADSEHGDLGSPAPNLSFVFQHGRQQLLETLLGLAKVACQHVVDIRQEGGSLAGNRLNIGDLRVQGVRRLQQPREPFLAWDGDGDEGRRVDGLQRTDGALQRCADLVESSGWRF